MQKKISTGGLGYARKEDYEYDGTKYKADLAHEDMVKILSEGEITQGKYGDQTEFNIKTKNGDKRATFNQATINVLIDGFETDDSKEWIGKEVKVLLNKTMIAGEKRIVAYFVTEGWFLDEFGDLAHPSEFQKNKEGEVKKPSEAPDYPESEEPVF